MPALFALPESYPNPVIQCLTLLDPPTFGEVHSDRKFDLEMDQRNKMRLADSDLNTTCSGPALTEQFMQDTAAKSRSASSVRQKATGKCDLTPR